MLRHLEPHKGNSLLTVMRYLASNCREFKYISKVAKALLDHDDEIERVKERLTELENRM